MEKEITYHTWTLKIQTIPLVQNPHFMFFNLNISSFNIGA
jgi:hypothetical protein